MKADTICCYCSVESRLVDVDYILFVNMESHCYEKVLQLVHNLYTKQQKITLAIPHFCRINKKDKSIPT